MTRHIPSTPPVWEGSAYIRAIAPERGGRRAWTHLAEVRSPEGQRCRAFVKHFPTEARRGLFNEWFGYTLMQSLGVPQPQAALMPAPVPALADAQTGACPQAWGFVSCVPAPIYEGTPKQIYDLRERKQNTALAKRLFACPALPLLIAADQLLKNADRNLGNLVFTGMSNFVAIDHSDILGGANWQAPAPVNTASDTAPHTEHAGSHSAQQAWVTSKLIEHFETLHTLKPALCSAILSSAELVSEAFLAAQDELALALGQSTNAEVAAAMQIVCARAAQLVAWFRDKLHMLT